MGLLARREHSAHQLQQKLAARGFSEQEAVQAVAALAGEGWQSDARYVETLVRSRIGQGFGPLRIESELESAGVDAKLIRQSLDASGSDWKAKAAELRGRKFGALPASGLKAADWQKQYRYLAGRGFESPHIYSALKSETPE